MPSFALKFLRDDDMSYNLFGMPSFYPTEVWNFFEFPMSNAVEPLDAENRQCEINTMLKKMTEANQEKVLSLKTTEESLGKNSDQSKC